MLHPAETPEAVEDADVRGVRLLDRALLAPALALALKALPPFIEADDADDCFLAFWFFLEPPLLLLTLKLTLLLSLWFLLIPLVAPAVSSAKAGLLWNVITPFHTAPPLLLTSRRGPAAAACGAILLHCRFAKKRC